MINNEFTLIGVATSNYRNIGNGNFPVYVANIEIEKRGSKVGNTFNLEFRVYGTNRAIDVSEHIQGRQIALNGYIDRFVSSDGKRDLTYLVAQSVYILGKQKAEVHDYTETEPSGTIGVADDDGDLPF